MNLKEHARTSSVSLFAGIGGFDLGFRGAGIEPVALCEIWGPAKAVLSDRFPDVPILPDIRTMRSLPRCDAVSAGFPCTDLSQAGRTAGIDGEQSGLVREVMRLLASAKKPPEWVILENVRNMLFLDRGRAMNVLVDGLESLGWRWAYRLVDARAFGLPQRRQRVILVASRRHDPRTVLFADEAGEPEDGWYRDDAYGFYWTEGRGGLGWAKDAVPTLKGGSTIGIPSSPAVWLPGEREGRRIVLPCVEDAEVLQGFPRGWTGAATGRRGNGLRWKLIGNAVPVPVAVWVAERLTDAGETACDSLPFPGNGRWPVAAWGDGSSRFAVHASMWPLRSPYHHLLDLLDLERAVPLSERATRGFIGRLEAGGLRVAPEEFRLDVKRHLASFGGSG